MEPVGVRNEGGKVAHERVGRLEEPRSVEADAPGVQAGFFEDFAPHGVFGALAAVDVSGDKDVARAAVLLNEQDAAGLFVCDDHADRRVVHGKAVFAADRAERHDALAFERLFDERRAALPAVFLYHGEKSFRVVEICDFCHRQSYFFRMIRFRSRQTSSTAAVTMPYSSVPMYHGADCMAYRPGRAL